MYMDAVREIRVLEEQMEQEKVRARAQAQSVEDAAHQQGRALLDAARQTVREADAAAARELEALAQQQRQSILAEAESDCQVLRSRAAEHMDEAAAFLVKKVVGR